MRITLSARLLGVLVARVLFAFAGAAGSVVSSRLAIPDLLLVRSGLGSATPEKKQ